MPDDESWRSQDATAYLDRVQRAGFAWEFLRRNPDYRAAYEHMSRDAMSGVTIVLEAALALSQRWGLSFPVRPEATQRPGTGVVGIQCASGCGDTHDGAAGDWIHNHAGSDSIGARHGTRRRPSHAVAAGEGGTADLDSSRYEPAGPDRRRYPIRYARGAARRSRPSPLAQPDGCRGAPGCLAADRTAAPPHDLDAEGT